MKSSKTNGKTGKGTASFLRRRVWLWCCLVAFSVCLAPGCQQQMAQQPSYRPLEPSDFFADGRSARPLLPGTIAQGQLQDDLPFFTGRNGSRKEAAEAAALVGSGNLGPLPLPILSASRFRLLALADFVTVFPVPVTAELLERGQQRFTIFCAVCHDPTGTGNGIIVQRGYTHPPSYVTDYARGFERRGIKVRLRDAPIGYFYEVVSKGYGAMPDYASQVPPRDRWAIIAYIRALQLSQHAPLQQLPEGERRDALQALEATP